MNRAEVREKLPDITDEQLEWLMAANGSDVNGAKSGLQARLDAAEAKARELEAVVEEAERAKEQNLTKEEQLERALEEMRSKQAETQKGYNRMSAAQVLGGLGLSEERLGDLLDMVVDDDADATSARAKALADTISAAVRSAVKDAAKDAQAKVPEPGGSAGSNPVSKEQFDQMSYSERLALFNESPETYEQLAKE